MQNNMQIGEINSRMKNLIKKYAEKGNTDLSIAKCRIKYVAYNAIINGSNGLRE